MEKVIDSSTIASRGYFWEKWCIVWVVFKTALLTSCPTIQSLIGLILVSYGWKAPRLFNEVEDISNMTCHKFGVRRFNFKISLPMRQRLGQLQGKCMASHLLCHRDRSRGHLLPPFSSDNHLTWCDQWLSRSYSSSPSWRAWEICVRLRCDNELLSVGTSVGVTPSLHHTLFYPKVADFSALFLFETEEWFWAISLFRCLQCCKEIIHLIAPKIWVAFNPVNCNSSICCKCDQNMNWQMLDVSIVIMFLENINVLLFSDHSMFFKEFSRSSRNDVQFVLFVFLKSTAVLLNTY